MPSRNPKIAPNKRLMLLRKGIMEMNSNILSSREKTKPTNLKTMKKIIKKETTFTKLELPKEKMEEKLARYSKYRPAIQEPMMTPKIEPMVLINPYHKPHQVKPKRIKAKTMSKIVIKGIIILCR